MPTPRSFAPAALLLPLLLSVACAQNQRVQNPVKRPIYPGRRPIYTKKYAQIPYWNGLPPNIQAIVGHKRELYVTTGTSGGRIYQVFRSGRVRLWFDVASAMLGSTGRPMSFQNKVHGGLRGLAFHPQFASNGLFYVSAMETVLRAQRAKLKYMSQPATGGIVADSVVLEWRYNHTARAVDPQSYRQVLRVGLRVYDHAIKQIVFLWRNLYIAHGDGSVQSATAGGGLVNDGLGKILRINPLKRGRRAYTIPPLNPFVRNAAWKNEIYAVGFRNPHNMCFSRAGELFVMDVGRDNVEEINLVTAGGNYGWSEREGVFVHLEQGGLLTGVGPLPEDDAKFGYTYPVVMVGHRGRRGAAFIGQALAGSCPIENGSLNNGLFLYANFPSNGEVYYSFISQMRRAVTKGPPGTLTQAVTYRATVYYDDDGDVRTPPKVLKDLREVVRLDAGFEDTVRANIRFGQGPYGELYWSSKANGRIYVISSTKRKFRV